MHSKHFNIDRLSYLFRLELFYARKPLLLIVFAGFGLLFFIGTLLALYTEPDTRVFDPTEGYTFNLIFGGFIITSLSYSNLGNRLKKYDFLLLPVSALERFVSIWILTTIGWVLVYTPVFWLYSLIANPISHLIFPNVQFVNFRFNNPMVFISIKVYLAMHGIFLLGSTMFRGYAFLKTTLSIMVILLLCGGSIFLILKDAFYQDHYCTVEGECELLDAILAGSVFAFWSFFFWYILPLVTWTLSYFGLKNQEV